MTNFNIQEGNDLIPLMDDFARLYNQDLSVKEIMETLNISKGKYATLRKYCSEEDLITLKNTGRRKKIKNETQSLFYCNPTKCAYKYYPIYRKGEYVCNCKTINEANFILMMLCNRESFYKCLDLNKLRLEVKQLMIKFNR